MKTFRCAVLSVLAACIFITLCAPSVFAQEFETPPTLQASSLLPKAVLAGTDYHVDNTVTNDGYLNTYLLRSRFGNFTVVSTALLRTRIAEVKAIAAMEKVSSANQFGGALADKGAQTVQGAANLVTRPAETLGSGLSGVGKMFVRARESMVESTPSKYEDDRLKKISGFSQTKRDYAKQFGVDPYSTNAVLQDRLNSIASAGFAGRITGSALQAMIPGGVGIAVSAVSGSAMLGEIDASLPPEDMRRQNRKMLSDMGVSSSMTRLFIDNDIFTPLQQAVIVKALDAMPNVREKETFVSFLVRTDNQDLALFRQRMSQMYAGYGKTVAPLSSFTALGRFVCAMKSDGALVLAFPLDYLVWTSTNATIVRAMNEASKSLSATGVELWVTGKASPMTIKEIKRLGWKLHENCSQQLLGT